MKTIILAELAILVAATACGNAQGQTPDAGSTFGYSSRQQVKCNTVTMPAGATQVQAQCTNVDDLPLSGSCSDPGPSPHNAILTGNGPLSWQGSLPGPAAWECAWALNGQAVNVPNATATICCVVKSP